MSDTSVTITAGTGTNIDTRTESTNGNHRQVMVLGDPSTNAGVAPVDSTYGLAVDVKRTTDSTSATASAFKSEVVGNVASGGTDSGNPVKVGGIYNSSGITLTDGKRGDLQLDPKGNLKIAQGSFTNAGSGNIWSNVYGDFTATANNGAKTITFSSYSSAVLSAVIGVVNFANGFIKRISSAGVVDILPLTNVAFSANVLTLSDMVSNFAVGDLVSVFVPGPDKAYDETLDARKVSLASTISGLLAGLENDTILYLPARRTDAWQATVTSADATTATTIKAKTAAKKTHVTDIVISVAVAMNVQIQDDSATVLMEQVYMPANSIYSKQFKTHLMGDTNKDINFIASTAGNISVSALGYVI